MKKKKHWSKSAHLLVTNFVDVEKPTFGADIDASHVFHTIYGGGANGRSSRLLSDIRHMLRLLYKEEKEGLERNGRINEIRIECTLLCDDKT
jgi:hypothetical protein